MTNSNKIYTYRCGEKVDLGKSLDQIVARGLPQHIGDADVVSVLHAGTDKGEFNRWAIKLSLM